MVVVNILF